MLKDIKRMTAELTGKIPVEYIEIASLLFRYKHTAFSAPSYALLTQLIYTVKSPSYKAKNLKDAANYENGWKIHICILPSMNDESLINLSNLSKREGTRVLNKQLCVH